MGIFSSKPSKKGPCKDGQLCSKCDCTTRRGDRHICTAVGAGAKKNNFKYCKYGDDEGSNCAVNRGSKRKPRWTKCLIPDGQTSTPSGTTPVNITTAGPEPDSPSPTVSPSGKGPCRNGQLCSECDCTKTHDGTRHICNSVAAGYAANRFKYCKYRSEGRPSSGCAVEQDGGHWTSCNAHAQQNSGGGGGSKKGWGKKCIPGKNECASGLCAPRHQKDNDGKPMPATCAGRFNAMDGTQPTGWQRSILQNEQFRGEDADVYESGAHQRTGRSDEGYEAYQPNDQPNYQPSDHYNLTFV